MKSSKEGAREKPTLQEVPRYGNQKPTFVINPVSTYTLGDDAAELGASYGLTPDPWQEEILKQWLAFNGDTYAATTCGLSVPRQNGKNALIEIRELYGITCPERDEYGNITKPAEKILHTAHEVKTARKAFLRLCSFFENKRQYPELAAMVKSIRKTNGQEAIELKEEYGGGCVEFSARSRGAARGFTCDVVIFDEAQELTDEQLDALLPTLAAAPSGNRQFIYTGTPPAPASPGEVFARIRKNAKDGLDEELSWYEWSIDKLPKVTTPEELARLAFDTNPAMGYRISYDFTIKEALSMSLDGFARERLGWWSEIASLVHAIGAKLWAKRAIEAIGTNYRCKKCFGLKFSPDGMNFALAGCKSNGHGEYAVELVEYGNTAGGVGMLAEWLLARKSNTCMIAIDGAGQADTLVSEMSGAPKGYLWRANTGNAIAAASGFLDALKSKKCVHTSAGVLDRAAEGCTKRQIGNKGGWSFAGEGAEALEACALALWACRNTKRNPKRKQRLQ